MDFDIIFGLLDLAIEASAQDHFEATIPYQAIEDLMDILTVQDSAKMYGTLTNSVRFDFLESRFDKVVEVSLSSSLY